MQSAAISMSLYAREIIVPKKEMLLLIFLQDMIKRHTKPTKDNKGGIISKENFIHLSNVKNLEIKKNEKKKIEGKK